VAGLLALLAGSRFVVDLTPGEQLSALDCARWLSQNTSAADCHTAAVADWISEVVGYRLALGVLGALILLIRQLLTRTARRRGRAPHLLPATVNDTVAATLFAVAGVWAAGMAVDMVAINGGRASGQWLSAAVVALLAAAVFIARLVRQLRRPSASAAAALATYA
jgi:hypothetical protein